MEHGAEGCGGTKQPIGAGWWEPECATLHHRHSGSRQAERGRLGCVKPPAIWLWMGLLRETRAGANLQKTLPVCLRTTVTCSSIPCESGRCDTEPGHVHTHYCTCPTRVRSVCHVQGWGGACYKSNAITGMNSHLSVS